MATGNFARLRKECRNTPDVLEHVNDALSRYIYASRRALHLRSDGSDIAAYEIRRIEDLAFVHTRVAYMCPMAVARDLVDYVAEMSVLGPYGRATWTCFTATVDELYPTARTP